MNKDCIAWEILKVDVFLMIGQLLNTGTVCFLLKSWKFEKPVPVCCTVLVHEDYLLET
jgi:hypothetical protein